jgi:ATP-dependent Clp endopeptidase proteolytic subunit ClpP
MPNTWFQFTNTADNEAEVSIYDAIGMWGVSAKSFVDELKKHTGKKLTVRINSPGGVVTEGLAIFNALKRHKGGVIVQIDALAASMATYIALAGAPIRMAENAYFMIHNVTGGAWGTPDEMRRAADVAEKMQKGIVAAYVAKTGKTVEEIEEKMDEETWFTAEEAKDFGFIDEITDPLEAAALLSDVSRELVSKFRNPPAALVDSATPRNSGTSPKPDPMKILTASLATLLATMSGKTLTEASSEAEVRAALEATDTKVKALEKDKVDLTARADTAEKQVTALQGEKTELQNKLTKAEGEVTTLKGEQKTVDQKAQELAAGMGGDPANKNAGEAAKSGGAHEGKAHYDAYQKAMKDGDNLKASQIWDKHLKEITAYVDTLDRKD